MSRFTENVSIRPIVSENRRITTSDLYWEIEYGVDDCIVVPAGFKFDGASVPCIFGMFIQKVEPKTLAASCLHDYLYVVDRRLGLSVSDRVFYQALVAMGVNKVKALLMYRGVRVGGFIYRYSLIPKFKRWIKRRL